MKARLTLPERPSALYLLAVVDVLVVLLIFFTLIPAVARQSGLRVEPVEISARLRSLDLGRTVVLTIKPGKPPQYYLETERLAYEDLEEALIEARDQLGVKSVIVSADANIHWKIIPHLTQIIDGVGLSADWVGVLPSGERTGPDRGGPEGGRTEEAREPPRTDASQP